MHIDPNVAEKAKKRKIVETDLSGLLQTTVSDVSQFFKKNFYYYTLGHW